MTVGELVYQKAIKDGYNPEEISPEMKKIAEAYQGVFDTVREPMKAVFSMVNTMQEPMRQAAKAASSMAEALEPQMEMIRKIQNSTSSIIPPPSMAKMTNLYSLQHSCDQSRKYGS